MEGALPATRRLETAASLSSADVILLSWDSVGGGHAGKVDPWEDPGLGGQAPGAPPGTTNGGRVPLGSMSSPGPEDGEPGVGGLGVKSGSAPVSPACPWGNGHLLGSSLDFKRVVCGRCESFGAWGVFRT